MSNVKRAGGRHRASTMKSMPEIPKVLPSQLEERAGQLDPSAKQCEASWTPHRGEMTEEQASHLRRIKSSFTFHVDQKYRAGQREHGGDLFTKPTLHVLDSAIEEVVDAYVYLTTIRERLRGY